MLHQEGPRQESVYLRRCQPDSDASDQTLTRIKIRKLPYLQVNNTSYQQGLRAISVTYQKTTFLLKRLKAL